MDTSQQGEHAPSLAHLDPIGIEALQISGCADAAIMKVFRANP
jgi:hypothetical protein